MPNELVDSLQENFARLQAAVVTDVTRHLESLRDAGVDFYGYAVLPPDYFTAAEPATLVVAYNGESDIDEEKREEVYYRYSVDEWENYIHDGFETANAQLKTLLPHFEASMKIDDDGDTKMAFVAAVNQTILDALISLRKDGTLDGVPYVVIWLSDSGDEIMDQSAKALNSAEVYAEYASEFEGY